MTAMAHDVQTESGPAISRVDWAPVPRVNLLPAEILEARRFRRMQGLLGAAVTLTLALAVLAVWWSQRAVSDAEEELAAVQARTTELQKQEQEYADVPKTIAEVEAAQEARAYVMANDILWHRYLGDLMSRKPDDVTFDSVTLTVSPPAAATDTAATAQTEAAAAENPLIEPGIGTVTLEGDADSYHDVAAWLDFLSALDGFGTSTLASADAGESTGTTEETGVTYSSGVAITAEALSHRYDAEQEGTEGS
jgi:Tfp pilus assembly protein PilN